jgi:nitroreductase/NAD-dependent dihydropyrimidine dehydrogenase PreA subunit
MPKVTINASLCKRHYVCTEICPHRLFVKQEADSIPQFISGDLCISCGHCVAICPEGAIIHEDFPTDSVKPINRELTPSSEQIAHMLKARRSVREFIDRPVERKLIDAIIDVARFAPSGCNSQSTEFVVVEDRNILKKIRELTSLYLSDMVKALHNPAMRRIACFIYKDGAEQMVSGLPVLKRFLELHDTGYEMILFNAPVLMVFHGVRNAPGSQVNATLALQNASLMAQALGLGHVYVSFVVAAVFKEKEIREILSIPKRNRVHGALALGYPKYQYENWVERRSPRVRWI